MPQHGSAQHAAGTSAGGSTRAAAPQPRTTHRLTSLRTRPSISVHRLSSRRASAACRAFLAAASASARAAASASARSSTAASRPRSACSCCSSDSTRASTCGFGLTQGGRRQEAGGTSQPVLTVSQSSRWQHSTEAGRARQHAPSSRHRPPAPAAPPPRPPAAAAPSSAAARPPAAARPRNTLLPPRRERWPLRPRRAAGFGWGKQEERVRCLLSGLQGATQQAAAGSCMQCSLQTHTPLQPSASGRACSSITRCRSSASCADSSAASRAASPFVRSSC